MVTHIVVDGLAVCGVRPPCVAASRHAAATCAACRAVLLYLGAPASALLDDDSLGVPNADETDGAGD